MEWSVGGANAQGQLGDGTTVNKNTPVSVSGLSSNVASVSAGYQHTCAVMTDGTARCWGRNDYGQLGNNTQTTSTVPVVVSGLSGVAKLSLGTTHTCALLTTGSIKCWGQNNNGAIGDSTASLRLTPVNVGGIANAVDVGVGGAHSCAVLSDGTGRCWGLGSEGQLGNNNVTTQYSPVAVTGLTNATAVAIGQYHSCVKTNTGGAYCWGAFAYGQLGNGQSGGSSVKVRTPQAVVGLAAPISQLTASSAGASNCALLTTGVAQCWGYNALRQLGTGDTLLRANPANITVISGTVLAIAIGGTTACANVSGTGAWCWGSNNVGQHGAGNVTAVTFAQHVVGY
jgi:alpha-tubulin suppressor-like RCC1 family protein